MRHFKLYVCVKMFHTADLVTRQDKQNRIRANDTELYR
jgi:hypothetical protein